MLIGAAIQGSTSLMLQYYMYYLYYVAASKVSGIFCSNLLEGSHIYTNVCQQHVFVNS